MTAAAALPRLDVTAFVEAFESFARVFRRVVEAISAAVRAWWPALRRIARNGRGYSSPPPLGIDGHAYTRRRRARERRQ